MLLMLFNVRLGWWFGNPRSGPQILPRREGPLLSILPVLDELAGRTTDTGDYIYLSDGGHFDNLGLYEMVRRRCRFILVSDAASDPAGAFEDLGNAVRKIWIDLGVRIEFDRLDVKAPAEPAGRRRLLRIGLDPLPGSAGRGRNPDLCETGVSRQRAARHPCLCGAPTSNSRMRARPTSGFSEIPDGELSRPRQPYHRESCAVRSKLHARRTGGLLDIEGTRPLGDLLSRKHAGAARPVVSDAADPRLTGVPGPGEGAHPPP